MGFADAAVGVFFRGNPSLGGTAGQTHAAGMGANRLKGGDNIHILPFVFSGKDGAAYTRAWVELKDEFFIFKVVK